MYKYVRYCGKKAKSPSTIYPSQCVVSAGHTPTSNSLTAWLHLSTIVIIGRRLTILFVLIGIENIIRLGKIGSRHLANIRDLQPIG